MLRVATDQVMINGTFYEEGNPYPGTYLEIEPGRIAVLSTMEELVMPNDLVGKIGIRIRYALRGLTGLMGIQVDPCYGRQRDGERLYIRVANLGNEVIRLLPGAAVFTFEVHQLLEPIDCSKFPKDSTWDVLKGGLSDQVDASWSYAIPFLLIPVVTIIHSMVFLRAPAKVLRGQRSGMATNCCSVRKGCGSWALWEL